MMNEDDEIKQAEDLVETVVPGLTIDEYNAIREKALNDAMSRRHNWMMKGVYLVCNSCPYPHRFYVGNGHVMVGIDDKGNPILKTKVMQSL